MATWLINGVAPETLGLTIIGGSFRTHGSSRMRLQRSSDFDAAELYAYGATVTLARDAAAYFTGKITSVPKYGTPDAEAQIYEITDAWEDLEKTVYQESWAINAYAYEFPRFIFGIGWDEITFGYLPISVGRIIENVINYAISAGVSIQLGSVPTGEIPIPSEMENMSCAEVIREAMRLHPDWVPYIDHSTIPPTFMVKEISAMSPAAFAVDGTDDVESFEVRERADLLPSAVRIIYEFATTIDNEVYRNAVIDKFPSGGPDAGPAVIQASIPLAGMQMQIQKSRIQTRTIPADETATNVKDFLKANYAHLATVPAGDIDVTGWEVNLVTEPDAHPSPINPQATRLTVSDAADLPRQLVRGSIEDWMRVKVGKVQVKPTIEAADGAAAESITAIAKGTPDIVITATNATTKLYRGITQWVAAEDVPEGIAQAVYESIHAAARYEGGITLRAVDVPAGSMLGTKVSLFGGLPAWESMAAPVHSMEFDVASGRLDIGFGPPPHLSPQDFLEMQRILRTRPTTWWSTDERGSNKLGGENDPSARGDTVSGYDQPQVLSGGGNGGGGGAAAGAFYTLIVDGTDTYLQGGTVSGGSGSETAANILVINSSGPTQTAGTHMYVEATGDGITSDGVLLPGWNITGATVGYATTVPENTLPTATAATGKKCYVDLGVFTDDAFFPSGAGNIEITHCLGSYHVIRA